MKAGKRLIRNVNSDSGFTLVETLVALMLTAAVGMALMHAYRFGNRAWQSASGRSAAIEDRLLVYGTIRGWMENIAPARVTDRPEFQLFAVEGSPTELTFTSFVKRDGTRDGQTRITLFLDAGANVLAARLVGEESALTLINPDLHDRVMLEDVADVTFRYFENGGPGQPGQWVERWERRSDAPAAIRMVLRRNGESSGVWPPLIVRPKVEDDVSCAFDPVTRDCREDGA